MKVVTSLVACLLILFGVSPFGLRGQPAKSPTVDQNVWAMNALKEIRTIQVSMTRRDLEKVFAEEGGLSSRRSRTYVYRQCFYLKVDVEFEPVERADGTWEESSHDKIVKMSKPYLDNPVLD